MLYLAIPQRAYDSIFTEKIGQLIVNYLQIQLIVFNEEIARIVLWKP